MKKLLFLILLSLSPRLILAQSCTGAVCTAATCGQSDVLAALPNGSAPATVTVNVPAGICTWTTALSYSVPSNVTTLTVQGVTVVSGSCGPGGSCTATDNTVIIDHYASGITMTFTTGSSSTVFRFTGITVKQDGSSTAKSNGIVQFNGSSQNFRMDHVHFIEVNGIGTLGVLTSGCVFGVVDHSLFDLGGPNTPNNGVRVGHGTCYGDSTGAGNGTWATASNWGQASFLFFENNTFNNGAANDCHQGGKQVWRYNLFNDAFVQAHEQEVDYRGCRATEVYNNTYNGNASDTFDSQYGLETRMGGTLMWGNTLTNQKTMLDMSNDRDNTGHGFGSAPPITTAAAMTGWGYCGTLGSGANQGPSNWDYSTATPGYPCIDQVGRGQGDLITGLFTPPSSTKINSASGIVSWPRNVLEPVYEWLNQYNAVPMGAVCGVNPSTPTISINTDYFCYTLTWNGTAFTGTAFNGTVGTGSGLLSARPSTCTAGPGGAQYTSPTGSYGVGYWATDTNTLYVCTSTNTWTAIYTPYVYPHPLDTSVTPAATSVVMFAESSPVVHSRPGGSLK